MQCSDDIGCLIQEAWQWLASDAGRQALWQLVKDLGALLGAVLAFLKWWERREAYVFGRLSSILGEQTTQTRDALRYVIGRIRRPSPADSPKIPIFAELPLRRLFTRRYWKPVLAFGDAFTSADRKLRRIHRRLDKRQRSASDYQTFVNEQRFAAYVLQGSIALGRSDVTTNENRLHRLNATAADSFESALRVPGKDADVEALELRGLVLRKLGRVDAVGGGAAQAFQQLQASAAAQLLTLEPGEAERRRELISTILRAARYRAEILHLQNPATAVGLGLLTAVEEHAQRAESPTGHRLLDRARYFEVNSCIRVALVRAGGLGIGEETSRRLHAATRDYEALRDDCDPKNWDWPTRIWRACARVFVEDGAKELLREAIAGLARLESIQNGPGCCSAHHAEAARIATPDQ